MRSVTGSRRFTYTLILRGRVTGFSFYYQVHINPEELLEYGGPEVPEGYVRRPEAAKRAGCKPQSLYTLARRNRVPSIKSRGAGVRPLCGPYRLHGTHCGQASEDEMTAALPLENAPRGTD